MLPFSLPLPIGQAIELQLATEAELEKARHGDEEWIMDMPIQAIVPPTLPGVLDLAIDTCLLQNMHLSMIRPNNSKHSKSGTDLLFDFEDGVSWTFTRTFFSMN